MPLKTISEKRLAANRANAQKSTGPRTKAGKAKVSGNAHRTGAYAKDHRMPEHIEAYFRARAEEKTRTIADPAHRALQFEWHMLQGHRTLYEKREIGLFKAGLAYAHGNEELAKDWILRQHGFIQALNRYDGWIDIRLRRVERALKAYPAAPDSPSESATAQDHNNPTPNPAPVSEPPNTSRNDTASFEASNPLKQDEATANHNPEPPSHHYPKATSKFEGSNPSEHPEPATTQHPDPQPSASPQSTTNSASPTPSTHHPRKPSQNLREQTHRKPSTTSRPPHHGCTIEDTVRDDDIFNPARPEPRAISNQNAQARPGRTKRHS